MELDPAHVSRVARAWDEQHPELIAAGHQIGGASPRGFTASVAGSASRFAAGWGRATAEMGEACASRAESMRTSVGLALAADARAEADLRAVLEAATAVR